MCPYIELAHLPPEIWPQIEVEEEELQSKEVEREVVTEVKVPQVKTLFRYKGQGMGFEKGEVSTTTELRMDDMLS